MAKKSTIKRYTAAELKAMRARGEDRTDWARVKAMTEEELERAIADDPDSDPPLDMSTITLTFPANKQGVFMRLDPEVLEYFRRDGAGYQTRINAVLRGYVDEMKKREARKPAAE